MKTPREVLLARHRVVEPKLDRIRERVLDAEFFAAGEKCRSDQGMQTWLAQAALKLWQELIWPSRRVWAGLATLWVALLAVNAAMRGSAELSQNRRSASAPEILQAMAEQKQALAELFRPEPPAPPVRPSRAAPQPRSERTTDWRAC